MELDPTAGPSATELSTWCLNDVALHENIKKTLNKFCVPTPMVIRYIVLVYSYMWYHIPDLV